HYCRTQRIVDRPWLLLGTPRQVYGRLHACWSPCWPGVGDSDCHGHMGYLQYHDACAAVCPGVGHLGDDCLLHRRAGTASFRTPCCTHPQAYAQGLHQGDFIRLRYGKPAWVLFLLISIFYGFIWLISMGMAGGILMNAIAGIPYEIGMSVILFVCVAYTLFGGLYAVIGTDYVQSVLILIGIVIIGVAVFQLVDFGTVYADLSTDKIGRAHV